MIRAKPPTGDKKTVQSTLLLVHFNKGDRLLRCNAGLFINGCA